MKRLLSTKDLTRDDAAALLDVAEDLANFAGARSRNCRTCAARPW
jgi:hypothetical protein